MICYLHHKYEENQLKEFEEVFIHHNNTRQSSWSGRQEYCFNGLVRKLNLYLSNTVKVKIHQVKMKFEIDASLYRVSHLLLNPALKILQQNLNRSRFVVWEMKRNVSVVHLIVVTRSSSPPANGKIIKEMLGSVASGIPYTTLHSCILFVNECQHMNKISVGILPTSNGIFD
jgi:hypothetical protein